MAFPLRVTWRKDPGLAMILIKRTGAFNAGAEDHGLQDNALHGLDNSLR